MSFPDVGGMFATIAGVTLFGMVFITVAVIGVIVWAIRRSAPAQRDPAEEELRDRLARGEIDMAEFDVRLRALREEVQGRARVTMHVARIRRRVTTAPGRGLCRRRAYKRGHRCSPSRMRASRRRDTRAPVPASPMEPTA